MNKSFPHRNAEQPTRADLDKLIVWIDGYLFPLATTVGVLQPGEGRSAVFSRDNVDLPTWSRFDSGQRLRAIQLLVHLAAMVQFSEEAHAGSDQVNHLWEDMFVRAEISASMAHGFLLALDDSRLDVIDRGAKGRRELGAKTRMEVMVEVAKIQGVFSKDAIAPIIASRINKSVSRVKAILTELYPGDSWDRDRN